MISFGVSSADIISRIKADLQNPANRIEGSFAADNVQAVGKEMAKYYAYVEYLQDMHYVETAEGEWLDKKAKDAGVYRKEAKKAFGKVKFIGNKGTVIPYDFIVSSETKNFRTTESGVIAENFIILDVEAIEPGSSSNIPEGTITKFDTIEGLKEVINIEATHNGTDIEDDESFRERTLLKMRYPGTSGNQYHYMHWAMEVDGVGRVKVFPLWDGPGTVKVSILDSNQGVAGEELRKKVKEHIDPGNGDGSALAPIGANLTVSTANAIPINIEAKITMVDIEGYTIDGIKEAMEVFLKEHLEDISYKANSLSFAKVIDILWTIEGVADIVSIKLNGLTENIKFGDEEIPVLGEVNIS